jgi:hypothetical protein
LTCDKVVARGFFWLKVFDDCLDFCSFEAWDRGF